MTWSERSSGSAGLRVAVAGGGLGGLCLAQGLVRAGVDVRVYERDTALDARRQGYRLHLDARAGLALQECLTARHFDLFLATCGQPGTTFTVLSEELRVLHELRGDPGRDTLAPETLSTSANRLTLREVLASGLGARLVLGRELVHYDVEDGTIALRFRDGSTEVADVLVGADGVNSRVRRQYLPEAEIRATGSLCIYGKTPLGGATPAVVPATMNDGFTAVVDRTLGMATGVVRFRSRPSEAAARIAPEVALTEVDDYLMWAVCAQRRRFPSGRPLAELEAGELHGVARDMIRAWHPSLRELVSCATPSETFLVEVRTSVPVPPWPPSPVTLLGDAIHAMSPARGSGANVALQDALFLARALGSLQHQDAAESDRAARLVHAIDGYERQMREYGFAAVAASRAAERTTWMHRAGGLLLRRFGPGRVADATPRASPPEAE